MLQVSLEAGDERVFIEIDFEILQHTVYICHILTERPPLSCPYSTHNYSLFSAASAHAHSAFTYAHLNENVLDILTHITTHEYVHSFDRLPCFEHFW